MGLLICGIKHIKSPSTWKLPILTNPPFPSVYSTCGHALSKTNIKSYDSILKYYDCFQNILLATPTLFWDERKEWTFFAI
jgi:hypothetical protein